MEKDLKQLEKVIGLFDFMCGIEMETEAGKKFAKDLQESVEQIIKPIARDCYKTIKKDGK